MHRRVPLEICLSNRDRLLSRLMVVRSGSLAIVELAGTAAAAGGDKPLAGERRRPVPRLLDHSDHCSGRSREHTMFRLSSVVAAADWLTHWAVSCESSASTGISRVAGRPATEARVVGSKVAPSDGGSPPAPRPDA
jgi:hypothetical protein